MSHEVVWTKKVLERFCEAAKLTDFERQVMETRIAGMTITQQAFYLSVSDSTVCRTVARLKKKYDAVQKEYPDELKPRRKTVYEDFMDNN